MTAPRSIEEIDADLHDAARQIGLWHVRSAELRDERQDLVRARDRDVLRLFDDENLNSPAIAEQLGIEPLLARQILHRNGRTKRGRDAIKAQLATLSPDPAVEERPVGNLAAGTQPPSGAGGSFSLKAR